MAIRYSYTATSPEKIAATLAKLFESMEEEGKVTRFATNNLLIAVSSEKSLDEVEEFIDLLSIVHPSRFFVINAASDPKELSAEVSARCQLLGKNEHVCSEVVRLHVGAERVECIPSLLLANLITGVPTECFVFDERANTDIIDQLLLMSEAVYFDSGEFDHNVEMVHHLSSSKASLVDLQWVKLSPWREQIRIAFERADAKELVGSLKNITIISSGESGAAAPTRLIAGWLLSKLGLEVRAAHTGLIGFKRDGGEVRLGFENIKSDAPSELQEVQLEFTPGKGGNRSMRFLKGHTLDSFIEIDRPIRHAAVLEADDKLSRMKRFFTIGESMINYPAALKRSLVIERLCKNSR